jgi:anti-sigma factor RsiW
MRERHYKSSLSAFIDRELPPADQQAVGEHLMKCPGCRSEHDRLKFGATMAHSLVQYDAPAEVWHSIERSVTERSTSRLGLLAHSSFFGSNGLAGAALAAVIVTVFASAAYLMLFRVETGGQANLERPEPVRQTRTSKVDEVAAVPPALEAAKTVENSNSPPQREAPAPSSAATSTTLASGASFAFETLAGQPKVGDASGAGKLAEGDFLETDAASKARIRVADIGNVEIEPNSRVKLIGTDPRQHRLSLERGALEAKIYAPPRLFIVDTPSAVAVDLGCAYRLEVDQDGNSFLHVTSGFVALERGGRESIVPAGAMCATRRGKGLGTPYSPDSNEQFKAALARFDFASGGSKAVAEMLEHRSRYDVITLWHLLSRVGKSDRGKIFEALVSYVALADGVTREGVLSLDKKMMERWRVDVENVWFN